MGRKKLWGSLFGLLLSFFCLASEEAAPFPLDHLAYGIPWTPDLLLERKDFVMGYSLKYRQAVWVCYILTDANVLGDKVKRQSSFQTDPAVTDRPVTPRDYTRTGYDRGHLVPAADMSFSMVAVKNSFLMTNITPQLPGCNRGVWKRLEKRVREMAVQEEVICVITGPIFETEAANVQRLGMTDIPVPVAFYKVILDLTPPMKMIGFIIPNNASRKSLKSFAVTVREVERQAGLNFFSSLPDELEEKLETEFDYEAWKFIRIETVSREPLSISDKN